jgi:beta-glucosidase
MSELAFPDGFLWGTATAAHQVEGWNSNTDWWDWELRPGTPCAEPSGAACDHYQRYAEDIAILAGLGLNAYRFSVEWARIEPSDGVFDPAELAHYRHMVDAARAAGLAPMVTLNHFTLPRWVAARGGWLAPETPAMFERFSRRVAESMGDAVGWYCTINEPGVVAFGGYLGALGFPPGRRGVGPWQRAIAGLVEGHRRARSAVKDVRPDAMVGATHSMQEWEANAGGRPVMEYIRRMNEDVFLDASSGDDFVGVQTYTRVRVELPGILAPLVRAGIASRTVRRGTVPLLLARRTRRQLGRSRGAPSARSTDMGYEYRPEAIAATIQRAVSLLPGKPIVVTEHGVATEHDTERVEFIERGLRSIHPLIEQGLPIRGYIHWSALDNFEWALGYRMRFGLIAVDRTTQERTVKPSARVLGAIARANRLPGGLATIRSAPPVSESSPG